MHQSRRSGYANERLTSSEEDRHHPDPRFGSPRAVPRHGGWEAYLFQVPKERGGTSDCYITDAGLEVRGLAHAGSCYELRLLHLFYREYIAKLPDGEAVLGDYGEKAPRIAKALRAEKDAHHVRLELYARYLAPTVALIVNGRWDEAYEVYRAMCEDMENRYLRERPASDEAFWGRKE